MTSPESSPLTLALFAVSTGENAREKTMTQIREVTTQELALYQSSILDVNKVLESFYVFAQKAMGDLDATLNDIRIVAGSTAIGSGDNTWRVNVEFRILNFCASVVAYYEKVLAELARLHGRDSEQWAKGSQLFNDLFDNSCAYRIVYNLRNALIHGSASLLKFGMDMMLPNEEADPSEALVKISVPLSRQDFGSGSANSKVRTEVRDLDEDPDLLGLCRKAHEDLSMLRSRILPLLHPDLTIHTQYLRDVIFEAGRSGGRPMMMKYEPNRFRETMQWIPLPNEVFDFVRSIYENTEPSKIAGR